MRGSERRRSSIPDARANHNSFASNRDNFREPMSRDSSRDFPPRDPPRGPKGLIDAPTGPRGNNYGSDFRGDFGYRGDFRGGGRGRGGRGRGWRDDSRDRGREPERDYRDRRDDRGPPREPFREDRGRDRDRWDRDPFRGRRASSPQGRGRSPNYGPRDIRDAPPPSDLDRARRGSRDGPLPAGSPSSDSLQSFVRGYGRAPRGRGRGRGGFYEDYHRQPGRSRSPDPNWNRRTQPSATPPPQVPAFGSTSSNLPVAAVPSSLPTGNPSESVTGPLPGVSIPTAPRNHVPMNDVRGIPRQRGGFSSSKWVNPAIKSQASTSANPESTDTRISNSYSPPSKRSHSPDSGTLPDNEASVPSHTLEGVRPSSSDANHSTAPIPRPDTSTSASRKRGSIIGRRAPKNLTQPLHEVTDDGSDSDSGDFDDNYFEDEIRKAEDEISKVSSDNPLVPRPVPPAVFIKPFLESTIDDMVLAHKSTNVEECVPPVVKQSPTPEAASTASTLAPKIRGKGKSRPATPLPELDVIAKPKASPKDATQPPGAEAQDQTPEPVKGRQAPSIIVPPASAVDKGRDLPDQVLGGPKLPAKAVANGRGPAMMDRFDDSEGEQSEAERLESLAAVRKQMKTPPISSLPNFNCVPWHQDKEFVKEMDERNPVVEAQIRKHLKESKEKILREQEEERQKYKERYLNYRRWTDFSDDPVAVRSREKFAKSRAKTAAEAAAPPPSAVPTAGAKPEGQRRTGSRFATEHDIERVLRESEQEAKETKEREERVARARTASAKEATIPDMCWNDEEWEKTKFIDKTHLVPFERSFARLEFGEPIDNFTEEEAEIFEKVYLEFPKQWTKIADGLPRRDYKACIQHYYVVKHTSSLKEKLKKHGKKKKGKGAAKGPKPKSNALMADLRDDAEDGQDTENGGERRRPRRAAAPTWPIETPQSESEVASPAPTPGRKAAATPKADTGSEQAPPKRRAKGTREKGSTKQSKNSQLLAAAPIAVANRRAESPATPAPSTEWKNNQRGSAGPSRFPPQYDGAGASQPNFAPPYAPPERPITAMPATFDATPQPYPTSERLDSAPPISFDSQQDRRNTPQTSSYWSVPETTDFPALLKHFGTDWHGIAKFMTSKTHIMVYKSVFQQWLAVPSDSNKSRLVANILTQVKNYYQRQVDSGKKEWEECAQEADEKRARGEPTGPLPQPTIVTKRRYDVSSGALPRAGSAVDGLDDLPPTGQGVVLAQASPPQPSLSARFAPLAQAGAVPHQPATPTSTLNKHLTQPIQQAPPQIQQQPRAPRGPALGYFNTERPIIHTDNISQRSLQAAQEAQLERSTALRLEREQREQQQQQAMQRERQFQLKQENDLPNPHQYEPYSTPPVHPGNMIPQSRADVPQQPIPNDLRRTAPPQQFQPRSHQAVRNLLSDNTGGNREIKSSPSPAIPRAPMSAPPASHEPYSAPPQPAPVAAVRQQETVRKTSNLMALLNNDEPSDPRPAPTKRVSDVSSSSLQQRSQTPPPQHSLQPSRYTAHSSHSSHSSQPTSQPTPQMPQQMAPQPTSQQLSQARHPYSQPSPHPIHQHSSSVEHARSYTPTSFENRAYGPPPSIQQQQQQQIFAQPPHQSIGSQPPSIRREPSLGEVHGVSSGYARAPAPSQPTMRLKESPYSATPPPPTQTGRQQGGSPLDLAPPSDRDFYSRQQYLMQQQSSAAASPQLGPSYHQAQQQQPSHRHLAFGQGQSHTASPPTSYASQRPSQRSRQNSFDGGRYPMPATSTPTPTQHGFPQPSQHQATHMSMQYQQPHPGRNQHEYERRIQDEFDRERRLREEAAYRSRLDEHRR
jgi:hypothetical protein